LTRTATLAVSCDAGQFTSGGGLVWLAHADDQLGQSQALGQQLRERRCGPVRHRLALLLRQRILQIACSYEDQDDADTLRHGPLLTLVCGSHLHKPSSDSASQLTTRVWRMPSTGVPVIAWHTPRLHSRDRIALVSP